MTPTPTDTPPEAPTVPDSERKGGCSAMPGSLLPELFEKLGEIKSYICIERTWSGSILDPETKIVWKCRCAAPGKFEATGDTPQEAISKALEIYAQIVTANE